MTRAGVTILGLLLLGLSATAQAVIRGVPQDGKPIFEARCASCHGPKGRGDGPLAPFLSPRPASLVSAGTSVKTDDELFEIIAKGKPRTAMPAWSDTLTEQQRWDLVAYIRELVVFHRKSLTPGPLAPADGQSVPPDRRSSIPRR